MLFQFILSEDESCMGIIPLDQKTIDLTCFKDGDYIAFCGRGNDFKTVNLQKASDLQYQLSQFILDIRHHTQRFVTMVTFDHAGISVEAKNIGGNAKKESLKEAIRKIFPEAQFTES